MPPKYLHCVYLRKTKGKAPSPSPKFKKNSDLILALTVPPDGGTVVVPCTPTVILDELKCCFFYRSRWGRCERRNIVFHPEPHFSVFQMKSLEYFRGSQRSYDSIKCFVPSLLIHYFRYFVIISPSKKACLLTLHLTTLNPYHPKTRNALTQASKNGHKPYYL